MTDPIILTTVPFAELKAELQQLIREEIKHCLNTQYNDEKLLSPKEAAKLFVPAISRATLNNWSKAGKIKKYQINGKVVYKQTEIIESAQSLKLYSR